eukprot:338145-Chlamydomonas_euryale.AAC.1
MASGVRLLSMDGMASGVRVLRMDGMARGRAARGVRCEQGPARLHLYLGHRRILRGSEPSKAQSAFENPLQSVLATWHIDRWCLGPHQAGPARLSTPTRSRRLRSAGPRRDTQL